MNLTMGKTAGDGEGKLTPEGTHNRLRQCELERELHHCSQEVKRLQAQLAMGVQVSFASCVLVRDWMAPAKPSRS